MNILLYSGLETASPGGIGTWTEQYIGYFAHNNEVNCYLVNNAVKGKRKNNLEKYSLFSEIKRLCYIDKQFRIVLKKAKFDVAHFNCSCSPFGIIRDYRYMKKIHRMDIPYVLHFHCDLEYQINKWPAFIKRLAGKKLKRIINWSSKTFVLNQKSSDYLLNCFNVSGIIVPNFIQKSNHINCDKTINNKLERVLFVGHVTKEKGIYELIDAAKERMDISFDIIGKYDESILDAIKTTNNINLLGAMSHEEVFKRILMADVFLLPSYSEGFSIALLEAMSLGTPCIASNVGANYEMIENVGGMIMKNVSPNDILTCLDKMKTKAVREKMSKWNIKKVTDFYTSDVVLENILNIYKSIITAKD